MDMSRIVKIMAGSQEVNAIEVDFEIGREEWSDYKLLDGGTVRLKTTVNRIYRVVDEQGNPRYNPDGSPFLVVAHKSDVISRI